MARHCREGDSSDRDSVDPAIVAGEPIRGIADCCGIGRESVRRYAKTHPSSALAGTQAASDRATAKTTLECMEDRCEIPGDVVQAARASGRSTTTLNASRELRQTAELLAKITGDLNDRSQVTGQPHGLAGGAERA
jgi:hypothetical protein